MAIGSKPAAATDGPHSGKMRDTSSRSEPTYRRAPESRSTTLPSELTTREREVLTLIARGLTNSEIAETLGISATTVKSHIGRIFVKLDLRDRPAVIVYAYENGVVTADHRSNQT